jgi:hypothetical protein
VSDTAGDVMSKKTFVKTDAFGKTLDSFVDGGIESTAAARTGQKTPQKIGLKGNGKFLWDRYLNASARQFLVKEHRVLRTSSMEKLSSTFCLNRGRRKAGKTLELRCSDGKL